RSLLAGPRACHRRCGALPPTATAGGLRERPPHLHRGAMSEGEAPRDRFVDPRRPCVARRPAGAHPALGAATDEGTGHDGAASWPEASWPAEPYGPASPSGSQPPRLILQWPPP